MMDMRTKIFARGFEFPTPFDFQAVPKPFEIHSIVTISNSVSNIL